MAEETMRVIVKNVVKAGSVWKIGAADSEGNVRTFTMHENDRDSGQPNTPPALNEDCIFVYATTTKEYQGKQQTTWWLNEVRMPQNPRAAEPLTHDERIAADQPQEIAEPKKDAYDVRQDETRISIEKQQALKFAVQFYAGSGVEPNVVVIVAWQFYNEFLSAPASPEDVDAALTEHLQSEVREAVGDPGPEYQQ